MKKRSLHRVNEHFERLSNTASAKRHSPARDDWSKESWRNFQVLQQPQYDNPEHLARVLKTLSRYPPLVFAGEILNLKRQLADVGRGRRFLLQGGDCAERFQDCTREAIVSKMKILLQMSVVLSYAARAPVVRIGRIAGQYAKPRSKDTQLVGGQQIPVFRGDNIHSFEPIAELRKPDPERLLTAYQCSSMTLNYIRALINGGFADLHHPENWKLSFMPRSSERVRYEGIVQSIHDAIAFMESFGALKEEQLGRIDFFTSHEGLLLNFEETLTRYVESENAFFNLGAHMLWIGDRTRRLDGAHVEYFRGIANPIGIKWGPSADPDEMIALLDRLNPHREEGKIVVITRFGHERVNAGLATAIAAVRSKKLPVVWSCDPMHGNTELVSGDIKTRDFKKILSELQATFKIHQELGSHLGGVHFELTGEDVTECIGGAEDLKPSDLKKQYETFCDPRLNYNQSLEMAFLISSILKATKAVHVTV